MALNIDYLTDLFGCITNRYHINLGRAKRICRTNNWTMMRNYGIGGYDIYHNTEREFIGRYTRGKLYIILEGKGKLSLQ